MGVVIEWMVSESMNLDEIILKTIKNERSEALWDEAMKNTYILGAGRGGEPWRGQKRGDQSVRMETREEGTEAKEGADFTKEGVFNNK